MNVAEYTSLINQPDAINDIQSIALEKIVMEFPYFQSARAMYLKGLYNNNSFKYNYALKICATHTTDRSVLFDFITSDNFTAIHKDLYAEKISALHEITVQDSEVVEDNSAKLEKKENTIEESILTTIKTAIPTFEEDVEWTIEEPIFEAVENNETLIDETPVIEITEIKQQNITEKLEIGKPIAFTKSEKHSFQEWLQLSAFKPIERDEVQEETEIEEKAEEKSLDIDSEKQKKNELIDKFIESSPKIPPVKKDEPIPSVFFEPSNADNSYLMTETLARVYLEQKKYQKAIQAYQILILKYPEKSSFFADRILDIKNLQNNNNK